MTPEESFKARAPKIIGWLGEDLGLGVDDAAAIIGNAGHESLGLTVLQEIRPTVRGSRGGWGWFQWTGPRRKAFEAWCAKEKKELASEAANYGFLLHELRTTEAAAIPALKRAKTLADKVVAFEKAFERAGVKSYNARIRWAVLAQQAFLANKPAGGPPPVPAPTPAPVPETPPAPPAVEQRTIWAILYDFFFGAKA